LNDEIQMTNAEINANAETRNMIRGAQTISHLCFVIPSSFAIRHSEF